MFLSLGALAVTVPLPWYAEAPFTVEPIEGEKLLTSLSGRLMRIAKQPGDRVEAGELIAELINDELEARIRKLSSDRDAQEKEIEMYRRLDRPRELQVAEQHLELLNGQMKEAAAMRAQTRIVSPVAGTIVAAPRTSPTSAEQLHGRLPGWTGSPLDEVNLGCFLDERTTICSVSPREQFRAVLLIDQADRRELAAGQHVRMKIEQSPQQTLQGSIESISDRSLDEAPKNLSNKYGGPLATVQATEGRETLTSAAFQASVPLESAAMPLRTGMRGSARVIVDHRSAWDWTWRWLRTTFRFRV
jgi:putative peptide zinc metalloprotease protein